MFTQSPNSSVPSTHNANSYFTCNFSGINLQRFNDDLHATDCANDPVLMILKLHLIHLWII